MYFRAQENMTELSHRPCISLLILSWCFGLLLGCCLAAAHGNACKALILAAPSSRASLPGLLLVTFLPFLFFVFAARISQLLIFFVCFIKAFLFSFCAFGMMSAFGSAGWLVCLLFFFADICCLPFFIWFALRHAKGREDALKRDLTVCLCAVILFSAIDFFYISPFLAMLI